MRIALLSDIHGNKLALDAVLADMEMHGPYDQVVVAGDLAWAGPWPAETVDRVRALDAVVIQGNTDAFLGRSPGDPPEDKQPGNFAPLINWTSARLGPERVGYLLGLPQSHRISPASGHDLLVVHANPFDQERHIAPDMDDAELDAVLGPASGCDWQVLAFGHLHVPFVRQWRGHVLVNVASAGLPMDGDRRAAYAILSWNGSNWEAEHHRVPYEVPVVVREMEACGMPRGKHFAQRLLRASYKM